MRGLERLLDLTRWSEQVYSNRREYRVRVPTRRLALWLEETIHTHINLGPMGRGGVGISIGGHGRPQRWAGVFV